MYKVRIRKLGFWVTLVLDSFFPCLPEGEPIFGRCERNLEMWVILIEKAFAKLYGRYGVLKIG